MCILQSAIVVSDELMADLKKAISEGNEQIISFQNERVYKWKKMDEYQYSILQKKSNLIDLVELFRNRVTYECLAAFGFDGSI